MVKKEVGEAMGVMVKGEAMGAVSHTPTNGEFSIRPKPATDISLSGGQMAGT